MTVDGEETRLATYGTLGAGAPEPPGYRRVAVDVSTADGVVRASIYV